MTVLPGHPKVPPSRHLYMVVDLGEKKIYSYTETSFCRCILVQVDPISNSILLFESLLVHQFEGLCCHH